MEGEKNKKIKSARNGDESTKGDQLPDDVLGLIFGRISDAKCLCRFSLYSDSFRSIIASNCTGIVTGEIPIHVNWVNFNLAPPLSPRHSPIFGFFSDPSQFLVHQHYQASRQIFSSVGHFLKHFRCIPTHNIQLSIDYGNNPAPTTDRFVKWKINVQSQRLKQFFIVSATSISPINIHDDVDDDDVDDDDDEDVKDGLDEDEKIWYREFQLSQMVNAYGRYLGLGMIARKEGLDLVSARVRDSEQWGEINVNGTEMAEIRNPLPTIADLELICGHYYVPKLQLWGSGVVLKEVKVGWIWTETLEKHYTDDNVVVQTLEEEDTILGEVFKEIYLGDEDPSFSRYTITGNNLI